MVSVLLTIHSLIVIALIGVVLLQRSEGGALGMGGGGMGGFMTGRGAANVLTRTTSVLAALFFATSLALGIIASRGEKEQSIIEQLTGSQTGTTSPTGSPAPATTDDLLKTLGSEPDANPAPDAATTTPPAETAPAQAPSEEPAEETPPPSENPGE